MTLTFHVTLKGQGHDLNMLSGHFIHSFSLYYEIPLELLLTTSELWFGQEQEGILPLLLSSSFIV